MVWPNTSPVTEIRVLVVLLVITVVLLPAPNVDGVVLGVPAPIMEIPTPETVMPEAQVQEPLGMLMVSPFTAT